VQLTPNGHPDMSACLNNLGNSLRCRFKHTGSDSDLSEAISVQKRAVLLTPDGHPDMPRHLNNLGNSIHSRFQRTGDPSDLSEAISIYQHAVQLTPDRHASMPALLNNLGSSFLCHFHLTNDFSSIQNATSIFQKSATSIGPPSGRLEAAHRWANLSMTHNLSCSVTAYGVAMELISEIAGTDRTIEQRHTHLIRISSSTTHAASDAFTLGEVEKALEWLEQGRCLVWGQLNQLRSPLDLLRAHDEHLAQRFSNISGALEASGSRRLSQGIDASLSEKVSLQDEAHLHSKLSREWSELLDEIRSIPQFRHFLRPPQTSDLLKYAPSDGVIVVVNVHQPRCDALALVSGADAPIHIPLKDFTHKEACELRKRLLSFISCHKIRMREVDRGGHPVKLPDAEKQSEIHLVLEALWLRVVKPILNGLAFSVSIHKFIMHHLFY